MRAEAILETCQSFCHYDAESEAVGRCWIFQPSAQLIHSEHIECSSTNTISTTNCTRGISASNKHLILNVKTSFDLSQVLVQFKTHGLVPLTLEFLGAEQNTRIVFHTLEAIFSICLLGNIVHLTQLEEETSQKKFLFPQFVVCYSYNYTLFYFEELFIVIWYFKNRNWSDINSIDIRNEWLI